jgi:hypothetical protein
LVVQTIEKRVEKFSELSGNAKNKQYFMEVADPLTEVVTIREEPSGPLCLTLRDIKTEQRGCLAMVQVFGAGNYHLELAILAK